MVNKIALTLSAAILCCSTSFSEPHMVLENPRQLFHQIAEAKKNGNRKAEIIAYQKLIVIDPNNRAYYVEIGKLYQEEDDYVSARAYYERYLARYPDDLDIRFFYAYTYYREGNYHIAKLQLLELLKADPEYVEAYVALARIYRIEGDLNEAEAYTKKAIELNPFQFDALVLQGDMDIAQGKYKEGYSSYAKVYYNNGDKEVLDKMIGVVDLVYPSFFTSGLYSTETEQDLILKINTVTLNTWESKTKLFFPIQDFFDLYYQFRYTPTQQKNLQLGVNNYYVNAYDAGLGVESHITPRFILKAQSNWAWGKEKGTTVFPFVGPFVWEPLASFTYRDETYLLGTSVGKDHFIGRSIADQTSFFVRRRYWDAVFEYAFARNPSAVGIDGSLAIYNDTSSNRKKEISPYLRIALPEFPFLVMGEFRFRYGNFRNISQNYYSYRRRQEIISRVTLQQTVGARFLAEAVYEFNWNKVSDFSNIAEAIVPGAPPSEVLKQNIFKASIAELHLKKVQTDRLTFDAMWRYYIDTNKYKANLFKASLLYIF